MKIGNKQVVNITSFLLPEGNICEFEFNHEDEDQIFTIIFKKNEETLNERRVNYSGEKNRLNLEFTNWNSNLRMCTPEPIEVGETANGFLIFILASITKSRGVHHVTIQTMVSENHE